MIHARRFRNVFMDGWECIELGMSITGGIYQIWIG